MARYEHLPLYKTARDLMVSIERESLRLSHSDTERPIGHPETMAKDLAPG
jgi:hypothetical protein